MKNHFFHQTQNTMTRQNFPLFYFGLFAAYLTVFNWGTPISWVFFAGAALTVIQLVRPRRTWAKSLFGLAVLFSLGYASSLIRVVADTQSLTPFLTSEANATFAWNCLVALTNFILVFFWFKNDLQSDKTQGLAG